MAIEAVKIPQNVYVEDRIVGPLTLRQLMIVAIGGGGSYAIWSSLTKAYGSLDVVTTAVAWIPAVISCAFAFIRINDLSLTRLLLLTVERMQKPTTRMWGPRAGISITIRTFAPADQKKRADPVTSAMALAKQSKLNELSGVLDSDDRGAPAAAPAEDVPDDLSPADEPLPAPVQEPTAAPDRRPAVDPARVSVDTQEDAPPVDGIRVRSSLYSSKPSHV